MFKQQKSNPSMFKEFTRQYLLVSAIPLVLFLLCVVTGGFIAQQHVSKLLTHATDDLNADAKAELESLGQKVIQDKARDAARQVALFLSLRPKMDILALQQSARFRKIAMQKIGKSGYVCLYESGTGIMRMHPNPELVDREMAFLASEIPSWWDIFKRSLPGKEISGYYDWIDPDGTVRKKYMTMTPVNAPFMGNQLMVAATTYIDEFSAPVAAMETKAEATAERFHRYFSNQMVLAAIITALFLAGIFCFVYLVGRRTALHYMLPIVSLADTVEKFGEGDWERSGDTRLIKREDEIGVLACAFESMRAQLHNLFKDLEDRVVELNKAQESLQESESHFRGLFDGVPVGLYRTTFGGRIVDANSTLVRMLGYPSKELFLSQKAEDMYARSVDRAEWQSLLEGPDVRNIYEVEMRRHDQSVLWVENHSRTVRRSDGSILYIEGSLIDITERMNAERALHESEKRFRDLYEDAERSKELYRSLLHSSADAIAICDTNQQTTYVSPVFTDLFGWSLDEVRGEEIAFIPDSEKESAASIVNEVLEKGTTRHGYETKRFTRDGQTIDVSISISRYEDHKGEPAGLLQILRDITDRKEMETQLQFAQRMEALGTLAGGLAHDFNNLMMGILGNISIMMMDSDDTNPHHGKLKKIESLVQSGSKLTNQLLGYARKGKFEINVFDLNRVIQESAEIFGRTRKEIAVCMDLSPDNCPIEADRSQIEQVLFNLFINAADAMPEGGDLRLATKTIRHTDIEPKSFKLKPGKYAILQITDMGHGMDAETKNRIFDPFFTTKEMGRGTGLGLASVYGIVKAHAGYIEVESEIGQGTTFTIYLPASKQIIRQITDNDEKIKFGKGTILVVDDEAMVLEIGTEMIGRMGYQPIAANTGEEALSYYRGNPEGIDMVVLDLIMPGTSGSETFEALRQVNPGVKVLLASGYSIDSQAMALMDQGCNGFIQKPYNLEDLSQKIDAILN